jgi:hypothetical protein
VYDPGRERRAERRARELLRSVVGPKAFEMYERLGFIAVERTADGGHGGYGYLLYPHRPIVAYDLASGELLSEYCVRFPDHGEPTDGARLPDADDVLAKWMALDGDERGLIADANMHLPGRQHDPEHLRRDLARLARWR